MSETPQKTQTYKHIPKLHLQPSPSFRASTYFPCAICTSSSVGCPGFVNGGSSRGAPSTRCTGFRSGRKPKAPRYMGMHTPKVLKRDKGILGRDFRP